MRGRTRCSPAKFVLVPHPHQISPQPAIAATWPRRPSWRGSTHYGPEPPAVSGAAEATRAGGVGRLPLAREAASPETPPLVPLLAFQQLKPGLRCHQSTCPAAGRNKPPIAGRHVAQLSNAPANTAVPAKVPLHLLLGRPGSSRWLAATSPSWEPPPTPPQPVARHPGGGSPALFLPSPPRRWAHGWSPGRGARPLPSSDYSGCGRGHHCSAGPSAGGAVAGGLNC